MSDSCLTPDAASPELYILLSMASPYVSTHRQHRLRHSHANRRHACLSRRSADGETGWGPSSLFQPVHQRPVYQSPFFCIMVCGFSVPIANEWPVSPRL